MRLFNNKSYITNKKNTDFYIGWQSNAPAFFTNYVKRVVLIILILATSLGFIIALFQKKFSTATFEYGRLTQVKGVYHSLPVPSIYVTTHADAFGKNTAIIIPLVGYGKHGVDDVIDFLEKSNRTILNNKEITVQGTLLYSDGKTLLQIDQNDDPLLSITAKKEILYHPIINDLGIVDLKGEIVDPKCYFGVMKPGHGKPHKDCAVRCIDGGINPVFKIKNKEGNIQYCLLLNSNGDKINVLVKNFIADPIQLHAKAVQYDDWVILYTNPKTDIHRISKSSFIKDKEEVISCSSSN